MTVFLASKSRTETRPRTTRVSVVVQRSSTSHLVPTTVAGHPFWEKSDPAEKAADQQQFLKNLSILGGLILAAVDTEGKPSLGWRGRRAARKLAEKTSDLTDQTEGTGDKVRQTLADTVDVAIGKFAA